MRGQRKILDTELIIMKDETLICIQCNSAFSFSVSDRVRFIRLGFDRPKRCQACRKRKPKGSDSGETWRKKGRTKPLWKMMSVD
jgi:hypothetical protein